MTKEMPWCCIYVQYIIQILLSKIYDKEVVQSRFLGWKMLLPLVVMPIMPSIVPVAGHVFLFPVAWVPATVDWINNLNKDNLLEKSKEAT